MSNRKLNSASFNSESATFLNSASFNSESSGSLPPFVRRHDHPKPPKY